MTNHTPTSELRCNKCTWIHEADSVKSTSFMGVGFCSEHVRAVNAHEEMLEALKFIAEGKGSFSMDPLQHAKNTINELKEVARQAIFKAEGK